MANWVYGLLKPPAEGNNLILGERSDRVGLAHLGRKATVHCSGARAGEGGGRRLVDGPAHVGGAHSALEGEGAHWRCERLFHLDSNLGWGQFDVSALWTRCLDGCHGSGIGRK